MHWINTNVSHKHPPVAELDRELVKEIVIPNVSRYSLCSEVTMW